MDDANRDSFSHQRYGKNSLSADASVSLDDVGVFRSYHKVSILDVDDFPVYHSPARW